MDEKTDIVVFIWEGGFLWDGKGRMLNDVMNDVVNVVIKCCYTKC